MRYRELGKSGLSASVIGLGTFEIGGSSWWDPVDQKVAVDTIKSATDMGINFIDTAPVYGFGQSEIIVGEAIKGIRDKVILCTKVGEEFSGRNEGRFHYNHDDRSVYTCLTRHAIMRQLEESLRNLQTDYIDIYMPHFFFDAPGVGEIDEVIETMSYLIEQGKIRAIGLSNISPGHFRRFVELGESKITCVQLYTNVLDHGLVSPDILEQSILCGISGIGINCLAKGLLTGTFPDDYLVRAGSERSESAWFCGGRVAQVNKMLASWEPIRNRHSASSAALSLAWVLSQRGVSHTLTGVTHVCHVLDAVRASEIELSVSELQFMSDIAVVLRNETVESMIGEATTRIETLAANGKPVAIWGAGVTLDYVCRRLPISSCNIVGVFDSNPLLWGQNRLGHIIKPLTDVGGVGKGVTLIVAIPKEPQVLDPVLMDGNYGFQSVLHVGHLKALCK